MDFVTHVLDILRIMLHHMPRFSRLFQFNATSGSYGPENDLKSCQKRPENTTVGPYINQGPKFKVEEENKKCRGIEERYQHSSLWWRQRSPRSDSKRWA